MSYEQNSKLYPKFGDDEIPYFYNNEDKYFEHWAPEDLQDFINGKNAISTVYKEFFGKKYPFIMGWHTTECGDPECCSLAYIDGGKLDIFRHSCQLEKKRQEIRGAKRGMLK